MDKYRVSFTSTNAEVEAKDEEEAKVKAWELLYGGDLYIEVENIEQVEPLAEG